MTRTNNQKKSTPLRIRIAACIVILFIGGLSLEALAWLCYYSKDKLSGLIRPVLSPIELRLDPYEMPSQEILGHWTLRPNYRATLLDVIEDKKESRKWLGARVIEDLAQSAVVPTGIQVNAHGFKGPAIDEKHKCPRILTIGDSVTFGLGSISYPHFMREYYKREGKGVEVINAGVEGYSPKNALNEVQQYRKLNPEIVTIYLGWNALYAIQKTEITPKAFSKIPWLFERIQYVLGQYFEDPNVQATKAYGKTLSPNKADADIEFWSKVKPGFMAEIAELANQLKSNGSEVHLISLIGLFQMDQNPTEIALKMGHLPRFTNNPYVLAAITNSFNHHLNVLAEANDFKFIDLYTWGRQNLLPLDEYFFDSVHLNHKGLKKVGEFLAIELMKSKKLNNNTCDRTK